MEEQTKQSLSNAVNEAALIRELLKHPGMAIMRRRVDSATNKLHSKWLLAENDEQANKIRLDGRGYENFFNFAKEIILIGDNAAKALNNAAPSDKSE